MWRKLIIIVCALGVAGAAAGGALYYFYPVQISTIAGLLRNYVLSLGAPAGTTTTETNPDYKGAGAAGVPPVAAGFSMLAWPAKPVHAKILVLGLDSPSTSR
jgi:hypothetical protein